MIDIIFKSFFVQGLSSEPYSHACASLSEIVFNIIFIIWNGTSGTSWVS